MRSTPSSKNTTKKNSSRRTTPHPPNHPVKRLFLFLALIVLGSSLASCEATYPAKRLTQELVKKVQEEYALDVTCRITGKTLWVYVPSEDLVDETSMLWNEKALEKVGQVLSVTRRVILSTDAELTFLAVVAADIKHFGAEFISIEYLPDVTQAMLAKFSRGEFFLRSVRDIAINPRIIGDRKGENHHFYDIAFGEFVGLQIIYRAKNLFVRNPTLSRLFDLKSSASTYQDGLIKIELEFIRKRYDLTQEEKKIKPLGLAKMIAAAVVKNYDYQDFSAIEITDTFSQESLSLSTQDLKKVKVDLPKIKD